MASIPEDSSDMDNIALAGGHKWLEVMIHVLTGYPNDTTDFSKPHLRQSVVNIYPVFVFLYAVIVIAGVLSNFAMIYSIIKEKLYRDQTYCYLINMALGNLVKCIFVLPISLMVLLIQNWIFGSFLCYFLPMLQDIPLHVSMLTFLMIAYDRFRFIQDPMKPRIPAFVFATGTWLMAICIVLPYPIYTTYLDLGHYNKAQFSGVGLCLLNLADDMQEYVRGLFIAMYVVPLSMTTYLYVKMSRELQFQEGPLAVIMYRARSRANSSPRCHSRNSGNPMQLRFRSPTANLDLYEAELDLIKEKRTQKYLITMVTVFAFCLCPLMVLRLAKHAVVETYENSGHFDITYTLFVWFAFLPTCTTPILYATWRMSRSTRDRLRGYFRLSSRNMRRYSETPLERQSGNSSNVGTSCGRDSEGALSTSAAVPSTCSHPVSHQRAL